MPHGSLTCFADWDFIHWASLNSTICDRHQDMRSWRWIYERKTLPCVLCDCKPHIGVWQLHHNSILASVSTVAMNHAVPSCSSQMCLDTIVMDEDKKKVLMINMTILFENQGQAFTKTQEWKLSKYKPLTDILREKGYNVMMYVLTVGALGSWNPRKESILWTCRVPPPSYVTLMRHRTVSKNIWWYYSCQGTTILYTG